ncbi:hypothetical protein, partial [uncultured Chloroflexus sp.]|uniref:hypothetical protein n=1 Tax=uncultured Chloroflexus sp. TaxID=214040 RepID=UPI00263926ED
DDAIFDVKTFLTGYSSTDHQPRSIRSLLASQPLGNLNNIFGNIQVATAQHCLFHDNFCIW